jgi:hypothetical protein
MPSNQKSSSTSGTSAKSELIRSFWSVVLPLVSVRVPRWSNRQATESYWIHAPSGIPDYRYDLWVRQHDAGISLSIEVKGDRAATKKKFDALLAHRAKIESSFGSSLVWDRLDEKSPSVITSVSVKEGYRSSPHLWPGIADKLVEQSLRFEDVLKKYLDTQAWIFQGNPDHFDLDAYLTNNKHIVWLANQHHQSMHPGQTVFLWRASGRKKAIAGIVAVGTIESSAADRIDDRKSVPLWVDPSNADKPGKRIDIRLIEKARPERILTKETLEQDPICHDLPVLKMPQRTNFELTSAHATRLARLWANIESECTRLELLKILHATLVHADDATPDHINRAIHGLALDLGRSVPSIRTLFTCFRALRAGAIHETEADPAVAAIHSEFGTNGRDGIDKLKQQVDLGDDPSINPDLNWNTDFESSVLSAYTEEGGRKLVTHVLIERNRQLVNQAKAKWFTQDPFLRCAVCSMSYAETYGDVGVGYIEAHHVSPLGSRMEATVPKEEDLVPVCASCHRMLHRTMNVSVEDLRRALNRKEH